MSNSLSLLQAGTSPIVLGASCWDERRSIDRVRSVEKRFVSESGIDSTRRSRVLCWRIGSESGTSKQLYSSVPPIEATAQQGDWGYETVEFADAMVEAATVTTSLEKWLLGLYEAYEPKLFTAACVKQKVPGRKNAKAIELLKAWLNESDAETVLEQEKSLEETKISIEVNRLSHRRLFP